MKELKITARSDNLHAVLDFVTEHMECAGISPPVQVQISIAVEEIFVNIAHYAYEAEGKGEALIRVTADSGSVTVEFTDGGIPYNPLDKPDPDILAGADERPIGGLGIFMVKKIMDTVEYRFESGKNMLTVKKIIS
ncbi:MAG: ATP-binding protein [Oscillospiraceae bacterium]|nr:ATP-binding protein [Oscillospiraceae bacterium]